MIGTLLLLTGFFLREAGGWGNIRPQRDLGWIEFLNNVKYPPSLVFLDGVAWHRPVAARTADSTAGEHRVVGLCAIRVWPNAPVFLPCALLFFDDLRIRLLSSGGFVGASLRCVGGDTRRVVSGVPSVSCLQDDPAKRLFLAPVIG